MRCILIALLAACGGDSGNGSEGTTPTTTVAVPDVGRFSNTTTIALEAGELHLGASSGSSDEIAFVLQAPQGQLVLFACDLIEAETAENAFRLGQVGYESEGGIERLGGMVPRSALRRLATEAAPRLQTCDEEIELDERQTQLLRAFVSGQPPPPEETFESRSIALEGLDMGFAISNLAPDVVRISLHIIEPHMELDDCEIVAIVGGETFPLGLMSLEPGGPNPHRHDQLEARLPRHNVQLLSMEDEASFIVCGDVWLLDQLTLRNIRSLVGTPDR